MKWVLNFIKENNFKYWFANFIIMLGEIIAYLVPIILLGKMIDDGLYQKNFSVIPILFIISVSMHFIGRISAYFGILLIDTVGYDLTNKLKVECYKKLNGLDNSFYEKNSVGEISTILITDVKIIQHNICYVIKQAMSMGIACGLAIIYCLTINPVLILIIMLPTPIIAVLSHKYIKQSKQLYIDQRDELSKLNGYIQENIEGNKLVKNFGTEEKEIENFKKKNNNLKRKNLKIKNENINYNNKIQFLSYCMQILLILFGGLFVIKGYTTLGNFVIINSFMGRIRYPFIEMSAFINDWQQFKISLSRIQKLLSSKNNIEDNGILKLERIKNNIIFENIGLKIDNKDILKNISFNMEANRTYAIIGEIGSGKSTIGKLILRLINSSYGKIKIDKHNIENYTLKTLRDNIGYVSQVPFLFSDTIFNNITFGNDKLSKEDVIKYLKLAKADYVFELPDSIYTVIGENGVSLSGGEKQRLSLARALAKEPSLLILDDITSALDYETEIEVTNNINSLNYKCTKLIIAQKIISVKKADRIYVMKDGKIIENGTHSELLKLNGLYKEIYDIQTKNLEEVI